MKVLLPNVDLNLSFKLRLQDDRAVLAALAATDPAVVARTATFVPDRPNQRGLRFDPPLTAPEVNVTSEPSSNVVGWTVEENTFRFSMGAR